MGAAVTLPAALLALFPDCPGQVTVAASSVGEAIAELDARWPGMRERLCDETPALRRHIRVFVDGACAGLQAPLHPGADVFVMTAISGG